MSDALGCRGDLRDRYAAAIVRETTKNVSNEPGYHIARYLVLVSSPRCRIGGANSDVARISYQKLSWSKTCNDVDKCMPSRSEQIVYNISWSQRKFILHHTWSVRYHGCWWLAEPV